MANDGPIASKLQLDGEQQYKKALNDAYRSLKVLRSELKAETAEMGRNATAQDKARAKMASLQKQIAQQEKIVKTLEKARFGSFQMELPIVSLRRMAYYLIFQRMTMVSF